MNRWLSVLCLGVAMSATGLVGCGDDSEETEDDGGTSSSQGQVSEQGASAMVVASTQALSGLSTGDGAAAANALASLGTAAWTVVAPAGQSGAQSLPPAETALGFARQAACEEQCEGDENAGSCTFSGCTTEVWGIEGSISWTATTLDCDLGYNGTYTGFTWDINLTCALTYSSTTLDGTVTSDGSYSGEANGQSFDVTWDSSVTYNDLVFPEGGGCPTAGSVDVEASISAQGQSYEGSGSVSFPNEFCTG